MDRCGAKTQAGEACGDYAVTRVQVSARGMVLIVPLCGRCRKTLDAQPKPSSVDSLLNDILKRR